MAQRPAISRRTSKEWATRCALAAGAAWLCYVAVTQSLAYTLRVGATELAHRLAPHNGRITASLSARVLQPDAKPQERELAETLARAALREDASAVDAVATLALVFQIRGQTAAARRLFAYSNLLSRRDLRTRLWLIEDAVARNDIPEVLRNYDIALRTSRQAGGILFPILSTAIADATIRESLIDTLAKKPAWSDIFIAHVAIYGPDTTAAASLLRSLHQRQIAMGTDVDAIIINRLFAQNRAQDAWTYYAAVTPGIETRRSRDPDFARAPEVPTTFDWQPIEGNGIGASIQSDQDGGFFDFAVASSGAGPILRQAQVLPPGNYLIEGRSTGLDQSDKSLPYWALSCLSGREIGRVTLPKSEQNNGRFAGTLTVPADCPVQYLTLVARTSDDIGGTTGQIRQVILRPAPQGMAK